VDASGRRCFLANQLGIRRRDPMFNQFCLFSWFRGVGPHPPGYEGFVFFHFLGLERAWAWHIPIKNDVSSIGIVTDKADFRKSGKSHEEFFASLVRRNRTFRHVMEEAVRVKPWWIEGDYSYRMESITGRGWLMIGDAFRFVDPIFSSGIDVALYSASYAHAAIRRALDEDQEEAAFSEYERLVNDGVDVWYETTDQFYRLQQLFTRFSLDRRYREDIARALQGNPYDPTNQARAKRVLADMRRAYGEVMAQPTNLLRPGALAVHGRDDEGGGVPSGSEDGSSSLAAAGADPP
jgi:flavin-dependent dehydrogenase